MLLQMILNTLVLRMLFLHIHLILRLKKRKFFLIHRIMLFIKNWLWSLIVIYQKMGINDMTLKQHPFERSNLDPDTQSWRPCGKEEKSFLPFSNISSIDKFFLSAIIDARIMSICKDRFDEIDSISKKIDILISELQTLNNSISSISGLQTARPLLTPSPSLVVVKEIPYSEAKHNVSEYIQSHESTDIAQIHQELGIDINFLIQIMDELKQEGMVILGDD